MEKRINYIFTALLVASMLLSACSQYEDMGGEGKVTLNIKTDNIVSVDGLAKTKASGQSNGVGSLVRIYSGEGLIRKYTDDLPESLWLQCGDYKVAAEMGEAKDAEFNTAVPFFKGEQPFTITKGGNTAVEVVCHIANTLVTVEFDPTIVETFNTYSAEVFTTRGRLTFTPENIDDVAYFMLPPGESTLGWAFTATSKEGVHFTKTNMINDAAGGKKYALTFSFEEDSHMYGGGILDLKVDETLLVKEDDILIYMRPSISGQDFDITQPLYVEVGKGERQVIWINTSSQLMSARAVGVNIPGIPENGSDFMNLTNEEKQTLAEAGISTEATYDASVDQSAMKIEFSTDFFSRLSEGEYNIDITATDYQEKTFTQRFSVVSSNAVVITSDVERSSIWTNRAVLRGSILRQTEDVLSFQYREANTTEWQSVNAQQDGNVMTADIGGLKPNTVYQYRAVAGSFVSMVEKTFTTEEARQLENNSFERWSGSSPLLVYGDGEDMFWDTGNHGSSTLGKNVTTSSTDTYKNDGSLSAMLKSQYVGIGATWGGKFAAGNLFVGRYVRTDGTDGVLEFGRPFTSRPAKLRFWYKYNSGVVDYSCDYIAKGDQDIANIYIALGDWSAPVEIRTKTSNRKLFDKNDENIIAFGELEQSQTVGEWTQCTITLDYRSLDRIPTYIVLTASASKYGDYFAGSTSSVLYLDDMELIYE